MTNEQLEGVVDMVTNSRLKKELLERVDVESLVKKLKTIEKKEYEPIDFKTLKPGDTIYMDVTIYR